MTPAEKFAGVDLKWMNPDDLTTTEECAYVMHELDAAIGRMQAEIRAYRKPSKEWTASTLGALKAAKRRRELVQERRGILRTKEKNQRVAESCRREDIRAAAFIRAAKRLLTGGQIVAIWDEVEKDLAGERTEGRG